jgi:hypothetical protein
MSKKDKAFSLAEDYQAITAMLPKLEAFMKVHKEMAAAYQKFRKNGGAAIPGIEKYLGIKEQKSTPSLTIIESEETAEIKAPEKGVATKKDKKKDKL